MSAGAYIDNFWYWVIATNERLCCEVIHRIADPLGLNYHMRPDHPSQVIFGPISESSLQDSIVVDDGVLCPAVEAVGNFVHLGYDTVVISDEIYAKLPQSLKLKVKRGTSIAGARLGNDAYLDDFVSTKTDKALTIMYSLMAVMENQEAVCLIRKCVTARLEYLSRTINPQITRRHFERYDLALFNAVADLCDAQSWKSDALAFRVFYQKGMHGWRQLSAFTEAAYIASFIVSKLHYKEVKMPDNMTVQLIRYNKRVNPSDKIALVDLANCGNGKFKGTDVSNGKQIQKILSTPICAVQAHKILMGVRAINSTHVWIMYNVLKDKDVYRSLYNLSYGTVLRQEPFKKGKPYYHNEVFTYLMRRLMLLDDPHGVGCLRLWRSANGICNLKCGHVFQKGGYCNIVIDPSLAHAEGKCKGITASKHFSLQSALMSLSARLQFMCGTCIGMLGPAHSIPTTGVRRNSTQPEDRSGKETKKKHPDVRIECPLMDTSLLVDVYVYNMDLTSSKNYRRKEFRDIDNQTSVELDFQHGFNRKSRTKIDYYGKLVSDHGHSFAPLGMSTFGQFDKGAGTSCVLHILSTRYSAIDGISPQTAIRRVKMYLQRCTLKRIADHGLATILRHGGLPIPQLPVAWSSVEERATLVAASHTFPEAWFTISRESGP